MDLFTPAIAFVNLVVLVIYAKDIARARKIGGLAPLAFSFVTCAIVILLLNEIVNETSVFFLLCFSLLFALLPFYYVRDSRKMVVFLAMIILEFFYATAVYGETLYPFVQMFAIGTAYGFIYIGGFKLVRYRHVRASKQLEVRRDFVHMALGAVIMSLFLVFSLYNAIWITMTLMLLGYAYSSWSGGKRRGRLFAVLNSFERPASIYGLGALYFAAGAALMMGFIHRLDFLFIGMAALFFADPAATIVGSTFDRVRLFYNRRKSLAGTIAFFAVVSVVGYPFIGAYSLVFGFCLAVIESANIPIDDNIAISVAMIAAYTIFLYYTRTLPV